MLPVTRCQRLELAITKNTKLSHAPATKNNPESLLWVARGWSGSLSQATIFGAPDRLQHTDTIARPLGLESVNTRYC
jgi:hypothetical protein